jgi:rsbT co-antagonist protein RsbR
MASGTQLANVITKYRADLLNEWIAAQLAPEAIRPGLLKTGELKEQCAEFLNLLKEAGDGASAPDASGSDYDGLRDMLARLSRSRSIQGFTPSETAMFVFSLKRPLFARLRREFGNDAPALEQEMWRATELLDQLGLYTTEVFQKSRDEIISRQQAEMLELSTPVVKLWDGILALPLIGTLDSARTQVVMESLLERIVDTGSQVAIIDITGVPTVDTLVAQHLMKTVAAARLMGVDCIISGIRPQIAQTIVHLAVDLGNVITKASLADAFRIALSMSGSAVVPARGTS